MLPGVTRSSENQIRLPRGSLIQIQAILPAPEITVSHIGSGSQPSGTGRTRCATKPVIGTSPNDKIAGFFNILVLLTCYLPDLTAADHDTPDADQKIRQELIKAIHHLRPLPERIQNLVRESGPAGITSQSSQAARQHDDQAVNTNAHTHVVKVALTDLRIQTAPQTDTIQIEFVAKGELVRISDGSVLNRFDARQDTGLITAESWTSERAKALSENFDHALDALAKKIFNIVFREKDAFNRDGVFTKQDAARVFALSKEQWNSKVMTAVATGNARANKNRNGTLTQTVIGKGYMRGIAPVYHDQDVSMPASILVSTGYSGSHPIAKKHEADPDLEKAMCKRTTEEMFPEYSVKCLAQPILDGFMFTFLVTNSKVQHWVKYAESATTTFYYAPEMVKVDGQMREVWEIQNLKQRDPKDDELSRRVHYEYDCQKKRFRFLSYSHHPEEMAGGKAIQTVSTTGRWHPILANTAASDIFKRVCAVE